ncbi:hypothetical protein EZS27_016268, partial [termite gut metagenome]
MTYGNLNDERGGEGNVRMFLS